MAMFLTALSPTWAWIGFIIGSNIHGKHDFDRRDLVASHSSAFDNDQVSATINSNLARFGFGADEAEKLRAGFHAAVDQFDDNEDESRKLLSDVLDKVLNQADVETIDGSLDVLGEKLDGLIPRGVDTTAGSKDGVKAGHIIITESTDSDSDNDLAPRDLDLSMTEIMATWLDSVENLHAGDGLISDALKKTPHDHKHDGHGSKPEKREEATNHSVPKPVEPEQSPDQNEPSVEHPTPTLPPGVTIPFLETLKAMGLLDNPTARPTTTPKDIFHVMSLARKLNGTDAQSLPDSERAAAKLKTMGLLEKPKGKRVMTIEEFYQYMSSHARKPEGTPELNKTLPSEIDAPAEAEPVHVPESQGSHTKRSVPEVPGCDCQATIDAVKDPKPEGPFMTYKFFQNWEHKAVNTSCIHPCVDKAVDHFAKYVEEYQAFEARVNREHLESLKAHGVSKREEPTTDLPAPAEGKAQMTNNEPPKSANPLRALTYRDWYKKTGKSGELCTCSLRSNWVWSWYMFLTKKSQRCSNFCSQSVKPFLEKEKETLAANATSTEEPSEGISPSPVVVSVPVTQVSKDGAPSEPVESEPEADDEA